MSDFTGTNAKRLVDSTEKIARSLAELTRVMTTFNENYAKSQENFKKWMDYVDPEEVDEDGTPIPLRFGEDGPTIGEGTAKMTDEGLVFTGKITDPTYANIVKGDPSFYKLVPDAVTEQKIQDGMLAFRRLTYRMRGDEKAARAGQVPEKEIWVKPGQSLRVWSNVHEMEGIAIATDDNGRVRVQFPNGENPEWIDREELDFLDLAAPAPKEETDGKE